MLLSMHYIYNTLEKWGWFRNAVYNEYFRLNLDLIYIYTYLVDMDLILYVN